jgi:hypothetical protein
LSVHGTASSDLRKSLDHHPRVQASNGSLYCTPAGAVEQALEVAEYKLSMFLDWQNLSSGEDCDSDAPQCD